jgi:hypothetical protein
MIEDGIEDETQSTAFPTLFVSDRELVRRLGVGINAARKSMRFGQHQVRKIDPCLAVAIHFGILGRIEIANPMANPSRPGITPPPIERKRSSSPLWLTDK